MVSKYQVDNPSHWEEIFTKEYNAVPIQGKATTVYQPIPEIEIPVIIDTSLVAIHCVSTQSPNNNRFIGSIIQLIDLPSAFPTPFANGESKSLFNNRTMLAEFSNYDGDYGLLFKPKFEIENVTLTIFKYTGLVNLNLEEQLFSLGQKIDQILSQLGVETPEVIAQQEEIATTVITNIL